MNFAICRPLISEKASLNVDNNKYTFIVDVHATKSQIRSDFKRLYANSNKDGKGQVEVASINTMYYEGKKKRRYSKGGVIEGRKANYKKAIITLRKGSSIDIYAVPGIKE